jgi:dipeptidyl aminopeptidase/acylaminoacyl peptidase
VPSLNSRRTHIGFTSQTFDKPSEAFVAKVDAPFMPAQVTRVQPQLNAALGRTEVLSWKSFDGQPVEGLLTYPIDYQKGMRVPLLVIIHGGPTGVFTNTFIGGAVAFEPYPIAAFASEGYAVLRVNPRGSSGYGRSFRYANMRDWGGGDYKDIMTGVDHAIALGVADSNRLGVMGWSYGGYLTAWIVTQTNRFKAASAGAAITNLLSMTGISDLPNVLPEYFHGELWQVHDLARSRSPVMNVATARTPTLIQHGEADIRVPTSQSYEFYNALKRRGVMTKFTVYPRQAHGFAEPKMTLDVAKANLEWFNRHLKGAVAVTPRDSSQQR